MKNKKWITIWLISILAFTLGCNPQAGNSLTEQSSEVANDNGPVINPQWPTFLPDDIPVLNGDIASVMGSPDTNVRIFFKPLSDHQINQYVEQCENNGFEIRFLVYTREGFVDRSDEKLKAGDYDAVEMSKGEYWMRLEYGSDIATLDINLPKTANQIHATDTPLAWPEDIANSVPQPELCQVGNIANLAFGGYQLTCKYNDGNIRLEEYLLVLENRGFQETDRLVNDEGQIVYITFESDSMSVKLNPQGFASMITFQIVPKEP